MAPLNKSSAFERRDDSPVRMYHVSKSYIAGQNALTDVSLELGKGEFVFYAPCCYRGFARKIAGRSRRPRLENLAVGDQLPQMQADRLPCEAQMFRQFRARRGTLFLYITANCLAC